MLIVCLENKRGQELFVVKLEYNNNVSVAVCRKDSFTTRQFKVEDLICDTSQFFLRNNAFIFFQKSDTVSGVANVSARLISEHRYFANASASRIVKCLAAA